MSLRESSGKELGDSGKGVESQVGAEISSSAMFYFLLLPPGPRTSLCGSLPWGCGLEAGWHAATREELRGRTSSL